MTKITSNDIMFLAHRVTFANQNPTFKQVLEVTTSSCLPTELVTIDSNRLTAMVLSVIRENTSR